MFFNSNKTKEQNKQNIKQKVCLRVSYVFLNLLPCVYNYNMIPLLYDKLFIFLFPDSFK